MEVLHVISRKKRLDIGIVDVHHLWVLLLVGHSRGAECGWFPLRRPVGDDHRSGRPADRAHHRSRHLLAKRRSAPRDERDKLIELRAMRVAYAGLATGIALACFFGAFDPPLVFNTNALLFILVTAEILRSTCQIIQYRRGA